MNHSLNDIKNSIIDYNNNMKISAYFTTRNAIQMRYPFKQSIRSVFCFADEIIVCDTSDGMDNTIQELNKLKTEFENIHNKNNFKIVTNPECNWNAPNSGIYDGLNKAYARSHCTGDLCFQLDIDEVIANVNKNWLLKVANKCLTPEEPILAFPFIEPWGNKGKIRCDINPWKERLSLNLSELTHGIPGQLRVKKNGLLYARPKSCDGCNMINKNNLQQVGFKTLSQILKPIAQPVLPAAPHLDDFANKIFKEWFENLTDKVPFVWHYSWYNIEDKIWKYKNFWANSWDSLYGEVRQNPPGFPFFKKPWKEVTEEDMKSMGNFLEEECGGHIFHSYYDGQKTKYITLKKSIPKL